VERNVATDPVARVRFRMAEVAKAEGVSAAARQFGVSRPTVYKVLERLATEGPKGLLNRPRGGQGGIAAEIVESIVLYKLDNVDRSTRKIQELVWREQGVKVSRQTVWRVLSERGLARIVEPTPIQPFERPQPNDLWQIDLMENEATRFGKVHLIAVLDDRSRYLVAGRFSERRSEEVVLSVLADGLEHWGRPGAILSDRGKQFRAQESLQGPQVTYQFILDLLGIRAVYARPYHPQTKGKIEKFFQFVQRDFLTEWRFKVGSLEELNAAFAQWTQWYNREHSHSSLGGKPPVVFYRPSARESPLNVRELCCSVERRKVTRESVVRYGGQKYKVPARYIGDSVWLHITEDEVVVKAQKQEIARHPLIRRQGNAA